MRCRGALYRVLELANRSYLHRKESILSVSCVLLSVCCLAIALMGPGIPVQTAVFLICFGLLSAIKLPTWVYTELARIVQETLPNVRKHSNAKQVPVRLSRQKGNGMLEMIGNGHGRAFSGRCSREVLQASGNGPVVIMERAARSIHGKVIVESIPGSVFSVEIAFPYPAGNHHL
jgi:signal transduction histidine kinase